MFVKALLLSTVLVTFTLVAENAPAVAGTATLVELDRGEPFDAMAFHAGYLFVGNSRKDFGNDFHVKIFDRKDQLVKQIALRHSVTHIRRYNAKSIIAVGTAYENNVGHSFFSVITVTGINQFTTRTVRIPIDAWAQDWIGTVGGREYFADMGGNPHDSEGDQNPNLPAQTIFSTDANGRPRYMKTRLRGPAFGVSRDSNLFIARFDSFGSGNNAIATVDTKTATLSQLKQKFSFIHDLQFKPASEILAVSERMGSQVSLVDLTSGEVGHAFTDGTSGAVDWLNKCLIASNIDEKKIHVFDATNFKEPKLLKSYAFDDTGAIFAKMRNMTVDAETGRVYGRSSIPCNPLVTKCDKTENSVAVIDTASAKEILAMCH